MKVGTLCYATNRGLGHLARSFHLNGIITDVMVVRHPRVPTNEDWYPGALETGMRPINSTLARQFASEMDAMLFFETPFDWGLIDFCRDIGVRTYLITMYECTPKHHPEPYRYLCPSLLDMQYFAGKGTKPPIFVHLPVEYPWRERGRVNHYVHNGGYLGLRGREGTTLLIDAMDYVLFPIHLTIRVQENVPDDYIRKIREDPRITYIPETIPYYDLYREGEAVVQPQKFNGVSLPLQEAYASGMLVITTDRFPTNTWLPKEPLIPTRGSCRAAIGGAYLEFDEAIIHPKDIAEKIDEWYGRDVSEYSCQAKEWAEDMSWKSLKPYWMEIVSC